MVASPADEVIPTAPEMPSPPPKDCTEKADLAPKPADITCIPPGKVEKAMSGEAEAGTRGVIEVDEEGGNGSGSGREC